MSASLEPEKKKLKMSEEIKVSEGGATELQCSVTGITLMDLQKDKFAILLPVIYPLNKSRCKSVIVGMRLDYENRTVKPVVGIMDQKCKGILLSEESCYELASCFNDIEEYFNSNSRKFADRLNEPMIHTGFSVQYTTLNCTSIITKLLGIRECGPDSRELHVNQGSVMMQSKSFYVLHEAEKLITDYLVNLHMLVPYVEECIIALRDFLQADLDNKGVNTNKDTLYAEVIRHIAKNSLRSGECWKQN